MEKVQVLRRSEWLLSSTDSGLRDDGSMATTHPVLSVLVCTPYRVVNCESRLVQAMLSRVHLGRQERSPRRPSSSSLLPLGEVVHGLSDNALARSQACRCEVALVHSGGVNVRVASVESSRRARVRVARLIHTTEQLAVSYVMEQREGAAHKPRTGILASDERSVTHDSIVSAMAQAGL